MTSRERLLCVLRGEIPDRVPVSCYELVGYDSYAYCNREPSYHDLMDYIREKTDCICMWNPGSNQGLGLTSVPGDWESSTEYLKDGHITTSKVHIGGKTLTTRNRIINGIYTSWNLEPLCKSLDDIDTVLSIPYREVTFDNSDSARILGELGDHGILMPSLSDPAYIAMSQMEFGESMIAVMQETDHFEEITKEFHRRNMQNLKNMMETTSGDIYRICGPEYITPPYLPPKYFERFMLPYLSDMVSLIHSYGRMVRIHCHGKIGKVIDMIAETGCDGTDPCEETPDGDITLSELKRRVGDRLCLFGSMQLKLLEKGCREDVVRETKRMMLEGKPGGRYVMMPAAGPIDVPLKHQTIENYHAYIDTALEYGSY